VHVIDTLVVTELEEALSPFQQKICDNLVDDARKEWSRHAAKIDGAANVRFEVRIDNRVRGLLAKAREAKADLLIVGAYGNRKPDVGMGTVATACVRHAHCPVLLIRDTMGGGFKNVAACADFSPTSLEAVDQAARICTQDNAALHVVHVFQPLWQDFSFPASMPVSTPDFHKQYQQTLLRRLKEWASKLGHPLDFVKPSYAAVEYPGHRTGIVDYAKANGIDLLVLGTRGKTNIRDVLLGSTAEKVLREAPCSVLAVRAVASEAGMDASAAPRAVVEPQLQQR
jgi:nucleotide-binding universal stress UspA family protein